MSLHLENEDIQSDATERTSSPACVCTCELCHYQLPCIAMMASVSTSVDEQNAAWERDQMAALEEEVIGLL